MGYSRDLDGRFIGFGVRLLQLTGDLPRNRFGAHVENQLIRSGTSVGANYQEAQAAESRADFIHKLQISLKEIRESVYWLQLLRASKAIQDSKLDPVLNEAQQLKAILSQAVLTAKANLNKALL